VLKDSATFTLRKNGGAIAGRRWWMPGIIRTMADNMLTRSGSILNASRGSLRGSANRTRDAPTNI
jgi:hypothetical protein